jgi:2-dehydropantoate 2-reductase
MKEFLVIGAGPIGGILCAHLLKQGVSASMVDINRERILTLRSEGLQVKDPRNQMTGDFEVRPTKLHCSLAEVTSRPDVVLICVKTNFLGDVVSDLCAHFDEIPPVTIVENGLDNEEYVAQRIGKDKVLRCVINYAGMMSSDTEVQITFFNRPNYLGVMDRNNEAFAEDLAARLTASGVETHYTGDIKKYEWKKAILNACLAPLSAITGLTMRDIMDAPHLREIVESLLAEGIRVGESAGVVFPPDFYEFSLSYLAKGGYHKPTMLMDIESGFSTEIEFLNGRIVEYGEKAGVDCHCNRMITSLIRGLELRNRMRTERRR